MFTKAVTLHSSLFSSKKDLLHDVSFIKDRLKAGFSPAFMLAHVARYL
jgi:hypothetical protein